MYTKSELGGRNYITRIISVVIVIACVITLFSPWVHLGLRMNDGRMVDLNTILKWIEGSSVDEIVRDVVNSDITDYVYDGVISKTARKDLSSVKKAVTKIGQAVKDSKLSPIETATVCTKILKVQSFSSKYNDSDILGDAATVVRISGIALWGLIWAFAALGLYCVFSSLTGKKMPLIPMMCIYYLLFAIYIAISVYVNLGMKDSLDDGFMLDLMGVKSTSVLHIQFAPILGSILLAANLVINKFLPAGMGETASMEKYRKSIGDFGKKMMWKCSCGATNPSSSKFCPKCGKSRPANIKPIDIKTDVVDKLVWTCSCGSVNPLKSAFCPKCGTMRPSSAVAPKPPVPTPPAAASRCRICGRPIAEGRTLCRECRSRTAAEYSSTPAHPAEKPVQTSDAGKPRTGKSLKPPTTLD